MYVHGFGTDDSYDEEKDKHSYGYGHIDPYLNAKHGYGYSKSYGYENYDKSYGYGHEGYGNGQDKVKNKPKKIHFSKLIFLIYRDMDTLHLMLSPPPTILPPLTQSPSTATTVMDMTTPPPAMGRDTEHPPRLLETVSGTVTVTHMVTAAINTWIRGD